MAGSDTGKAAPRSAALRTRSRRVSMAFPFLGMIGALRRLAPPVAKAGEPLEAERLGATKRARRWPSIGPNQMARNRSFVAYACLHLFERMGQGADRPGQH